MIYWEIIPTDRYTIVEISGQKVIDFKESGIRIYIRNNYPIEKFEENKLLIGSLKRISKKSFELFPGDNFVFCYLNDWGIKNDIEILYPEDCKFFIIKTNKIYDFPKPQVITIASAIIETPQFPVICKLIRDEKEEMGFIEPDVSKIDDEYLNKVVEIIKNLKIQGG
jgi:hypothetical protein